MAYTIVSFCGGGVRGLMSAIILDRLSRINGNILTKTSLLAGTSTGAGIVSGLVGGQKVKDIIDTFYYEAAEFYSKPNDDASAPAYPNDSFVAAQKKLHGTKPISSLTHQQVLFTAFNVGSAPVDGGSATAWYPQLFTNVPKAPIPTESTLIVDAVVASGSMPGMLPSYNGNVDGAFVNHDPTLAAIALAVNSGVDINEIAAICIGTGFMENWIGSDTAQWGASQWLNGDGTGNYKTPALLVNESCVCPILNISLNGTSSNLIPMLSKMLLSGRYVNLNPTLDQYVPENAHLAEQILYLASQADAIPQRDWDAAKHLLKTYWER
ncbi:MAG: patatin-like phospholipase family protein [Acidobacteria bacterium]|nr:patatin-like phospholipase family protein [Acidobacteriota bacterium]